MEHHFNISVGDAWRRIYRKVRCVQVCCDCTSALECPSNIAHSFGLIMWELLTGVDPFDEYPVAHSGFMSVLEDEIIAGLRYSHARTLRDDIGTVLTTTCRPTIPSACNSDYRALIEAAWNDDPEKRPTFAAIHTELSCIKASKFNTMRK